MEKKTRKTYTIDFAKNTITITPSMMKKAQDIKSDAFKTLAAIRKDFPNFEIIEAAARRMNRPSMEGLTIDFIEAYIYIKSPASATEYQNRKKSAMIRGKNPYMALRKWFNETFIDWRAYLKDEEIIKVIEKKDSEQQEAPKSTQEAFGSVEESNMEDVA